jgi:hypothetical protein
LFCREVGGAVGGVKDSVRDSYIDIPKCSLYEVNETMYFEVHILVEGQELDALKHIKYVHLSDIHVHHILKREKTNYCTLPPSPSPLSPPPLSLSFSLPPPLSLRTYSFKELFHSAFQSL